MLNDIAKEILRRCGELLKNDMADDKALIMAQTICHEQRDNPALADDIAGYTMIADEVSDGLFSATLQSWQAAKKH